MGNLARAPISGALQQLLLKKLMQETLQETPSEASGC